MDHNPAIDLFAAVASITRAPTHRIAGAPLTDLLAVPFEEDAKDPSVWFLDHNYVESMNDMFKKVNAREKLIGWYHTGPKLRASDLEINELFKRYTPNPLLVIIDVQPKEVGVPTDAYFAVEEIKDVSLASDFQRYEG